MKKSVLKLTLGIAAFAATSAITQAQTATTTTAAPAAPPTAFDEYVQQIKNPCDWFSWGGDFRVRNEYFDNALSLGSSPRSAGRLPPCMNRTIFVFAAGFGPASFRPTI